MPPELLILAQIYTKSCVGWGFTPDPTGGAYSAPNPIDPLAGLGGGAPGKGKEGGDGKRMEWRRWRGGERKGGEGVPECPNPELASLVPYE